MTGAAATAAVATLATGCGADGKVGASRPPAIDLAKLPQATTFTTLRGLPLDIEPSTADAGTVVHPSATVPVSSEPGGPPVAALPNRQLDGPTWVPVIDTRPGWRRVLLPSRPNGTTGWIPESAARLTTAHTPYAVRVRTKARRLTITKSDRRIGSWTVAVGATKTPTPTGRTFMLALLKPSRPTFSPLVLPVGSHSETLDTFGGGPGTVAFHGWNDASVFGKAVTHGCVRVPAAALAELAKVPLGTPVVVTE
ncbi:L,D-transpeptidase family protein [Actinomadura craniellae]|uniref:L,D-transpeptidase family protein n=1 Tax=Actinomadura craniellae TaxID=2231787 RepID=UPI001F33C92D|nr:L,D-transpeptidase [Actinomadura craniellae]